MSDTLQPDRIEPLLRATIGTPRLSPAQRQRQLARLRLSHGAPTPMQLQPALAGATLDESGHSAADYPERSWRSRRGWAELAVVAVVAVLLVVGVVIVRDQAQQSDGPQPGIPIEQIMMAEGWPEPGEGLHVVVEFQTDYPYDDSTRRTWRVEQWQRVLEDGTDQEHRVMYDAEGEQLIALTTNGDAWSWIIDDWVEAGTRSVGVAGLPQQFTVTFVEPGMAASSLGSLAGNQAELDGVVVERFSDARGDITRVRNADSQRVFEEENRLFDVTVTGSYYEIVQDPATGNVLYTRGFLATEEGVEITLAQWNFIVVEAIPAAEMDSALFDVLPDPEFPHFDVPTALPWGFALESHIDESLVASERLVYAAGDMEVVVNVQATRGDYDPSRFVATRSDPSIVRTTPSAAGPITWIAGAAGDSPAGAYWDDGHYRFNLSIAGEVLDDWDESALVAVVEALSGNAGAAVNEQTGPPPEPGVPADLVLAVADGPAPGEGLYAVVNIETDYRDDHSQRSAWSVESWRRVLPDGTKQERYVLRDPDGKVFTSYTINGDAWALDRSGWVTTGTSGAGFRTISPQLGWSMAEPGNAARFLDEQADSDQVDIIQDARGEVFRLRTDEGESFEQESRQFGVTVNGMVFEMVRDPVTGNVLETRAYLTSEEGVEITFMLAAISVVESMPADQIPDAQFELLSESAFPIYAAPQQLPGGFVLESHIDDFLAGSERLVYANQTQTAELIVNVYPSRGGYDPSNLIATRSEDAVVETIDSAAGPVTWLAGEEDISPVAAYWDDGRSYFELSLVGEAPDNWDTTALIAVVEALSAVP